MILNTTKIKTIMDKLLVTCLLLLLATVLVACGKDSGGSSEDKTDPVASLTSLNSGEEVIGDFTITWTTNDPNPSTVDIYLSSDSGSTYPIIVAINAPDTGSYVWDTNTVRDCRDCRLRIVPTDVVGNEGSPTDSAQDFIVNNVPQVLGAAYYTDVNADGLRDGDTIRVPFDKELELFTSIASDIFLFPVLGDSIGSFAEIARNDNNRNELIITLNNVGKSKEHLHLGGQFNIGALNRTAPSGINLQNNINEGIIFAPDTGRTAAVAKLGIDILPTYSDSGQIFSDATTTIKAIALGDLDGDGDLDMVAGQRSTVTSSTRSNLVFRNDGGVFINTFQPLGNANTNSIVLGDVDGDGDLDIVASNDSGNSRVWLNGGDNSGSNTGVFADSGQNLPEVEAAALGDIDGDGDLDLVFGRTMSPVIGSGNRVYLNGGDNSGSNTGVYTNSFQNLGSGVTRSIALGDVDGDGDLDMVVGNSRSDTVWINGGDNSGSNTGVFTDSTQAIGGDYTYSLALGDMDGDGDLDIVTVNNGSKLVWLNGGDNSGSNTGVYADSGQRLGTSSNAAIVLGDMDLDGDLDIMEAELGAKVWLNGGDSSGSNTGLFIMSSGQESNLSHPTAVALGDVDGDGDLDMISGGNAPVSPTFYDEPNVVWLNSLRHPSDDIIIDSTQLLGAGYTRSVALGDLDGDGDFDMVTGNAGSSSISTSPNRVWINNADSAATGKGVYSDTGQSLGDAYTEAVVLGDVDGDGDLDLIAMNTWGTSSLLWLNDGTGAFTESPSQTLPRGTSAMLIDVDNDLDLDLVAGSFSGSTVWLNGGDNSGSNTGVFADSGQDLFNTALASEVSLSIGDVDGDGDPDIFLGSDDTSIGDVVWLNGGDNSGSYTGIFGFGSSPASFTMVSTLGDVNGDGNLDLITIDPADIRVRLNNGAGVFNNIVQTLGISANSVVLIDIDGDDDLDMVLGISDSGGVNSLYLNDGAGVFTDSGLTLGSYSTNSLDLGDVDGDGDLDIVTGNDYEQPNKVWLNDF